jgi:hypothetical protein
LKQKHHQGNYDRAKRAVGLRKVRSMTHSRTPFELR